MNSSIKKLFSLSLFAAAVSIVSSTALAHSYYLRADAGYSHPKRWAYKTNGAFTGQVGAGYVFNSSFRSDFTASYRGDYKYSDDNAKQKSSSIGLMLNGYFSPTKFRTVSPYIMAGVGLGINKVGRGNFVRNGKQSILFGDSKRSLAWQVGVGSLFDITKCLKADFMYRYLDSGTIRSEEGTYEEPDMFYFGNRAKGKLRSHEFSIGLQFKI